MTCHRTPGTIEHALFQAQRLLTEEQLQALIGRGKETLKALSNPNGSKGCAPLSLVEAQKLHLVLTGMGHGHVFAMLFPQHNSEHDPMDAPLHLTRALGEVAEVLLKAMEDGVIERHEYRELADRLFDLTRLSHAHMTGANLRAGANLSVAAE